MFLVEIAIIIIIWGVNPTCFGQSPMIFSEVGPDSSREQQRPMAAMPRHATPPRRRRVYGPIPKPAQLSRKNGDFSPVFNQNSITSTLGIQNGDTFDHVFWDYDDSPKDE